jgi:hypothetical protein
MNHSSPIVLTNAAALVLIVSLIIFKFRFDRRPAKD